MNGSHHYDNGLANLRHIIQNASARYANEFVWQDVQLTNEFKNAYTGYLEKTNYSIEFFDSTAVITTPLNKYIFVPNQWFVIASYAVDVYIELIYYKECFKDVSADLGKRPDSYAKALRDSASISDKTLFINSARHVLQRRIRNEKLEDSCNKLWKFVTDYSWWSGQKTVDRGDFYISVILNMLNLVNVSQGYVADIVNAYGNDFYLQTLVKSIDAFTIDLACNIISDEIGSVESGEVKDELFPETSKAVTPEDNGRPRRIKITINKNREIKY